MRLYGGNGSPFVRKVAVTAIELGVDNRIERLPSNGSGTSINSIAVTENPVRKMPALVLDDGESLFDSRMIMRYLNDLAGGSLYPAGDWAMQARESYAEGLIDAALLVRFETALRPADKQWQEWIDGQSAKINSILDAMERDAGAMTGVDGAAITFGCALGYLEFRFGDWGWRNGRPALAAWFEGFSARPSMQSTPQV
jgi:glutathione S-transferase